MPPTVRIESDLLTFLREHRHAGKWVTAETDLFDAGVLDSLMLLDLILKIEKDYGVVLGGTDVTRKNFCSIAQLGQLVAMRLAGESRKAA